MAFTTDLWTGKNSDCFLALTVNFIDEKFRFHSYVLGISYLNYKI